MDIFLKKVYHYDFPVPLLIPDTQRDIEELKKLPTQTALRATIKQPRNYEFHKKYFALLNYAYENWEPPENHVAHKNFDRFRKDIIILAGYYDTTVRLDGSTRLEAKSISFGSMSAEDFESLYEASITVIVKHVLTHLDGDTLKTVLEQVEQFT